MHLKAVILVVVATLAAQAKGDSKGFTVSGTTILDSQGRPFVMRGINHAHSWFKDDADTAIPAIAATGANVVRLVLSNGDRWWYDDVDAISHLLDLCTKHKLVAIIDVHDTMGNDSYEALQNATNRWVELADFLRGREDRVIINIANEWMSSFGKGDVWAASYRTMIPQIRKAGYKHLLLVDCSGWAQDAAVISQYGRSVFESDPERNLAFAIHMYEGAAPDAATVHKNIDSSLAIGVPLVIGEFSNRQNGVDIDYKTVMKYCDERNVGWLAWSWYGNSDYNANMDLCSGPDGGLTALGNEIIEGPHGIRRTAKAANVNW